MHLYSVTTLLHILLVTLHHQHALVDQNVVRLVYQRASVGGQVRDRFELICQPLHATQAVGTAPLPVVNNPQQHSPILVQ